ncbi:MAG: M23 family metallopeptidase [Patescibacteria group bacterium]
MRKKILKVAAIVLLIVIMFFAWKLFIRFLPFIPHERIAISLPFDEKDDDLIFINPMGEKVMHPNAPHGHPGIDFGWHHPAPLIAVADGRVTKIKEHRSGGYGETEKIYDVEIVSGIYAIRYTEIAPAANIKVGTEVKKGDVIGRGGEYNQPGGLGLYYSTHWEFDYNNFWTDRLCPLTYFDRDSLSRINVIWKKVGTTYDGKYPEICSGGYKGKDN